MDARLMNAFLPAREMRDPKRFAGREEQIRMLYNGLATEGAHIVIYGRRGVGKSSLAEQLQLIAKGDAAALERFKMRPVSKQPMLVFAVKCDDTVRTVDDLLVRLISEEDLLQPFVPLTISRTTETDEVGGGLDIGIAKFGGRGEAAVEKTTAAVSPANVATFRNAVKRATKTKPESTMLIVIDEFDRVADKNGLASIIKSLSSENVKFALIGVSTDIHALIADHKSVERQLAEGTVLVPAMSNADLNEIFDRASESLDQEYTFAKDLRDWVIRLAKGHPFYVHLLGKHALLRAAEGGRSEVSLQDGKDSWNDIVTKGSAPALEMLYKKAIGHSFIRESILQAFATVDEDEIHTTELYARLAAQLGIDSAAISVYVGQLAGEKYGAVLRKTKDRYYSFQDSMFKAYVNARPFQLKAGQEDPTPMDKAA